MTAISIFQNAKILVLNVERIQDSNELQDSILTVHHCYMVAFMNTPAYKIIENHDGAAFMKIAQMQLVKKS